MIWCGLDIATAFSEVLSERMAQSISAISNLAQSNAANPNETAPTKIFFLCSESTQAMCDDLIDDTIGNISKDNMLIIPDGEVGKTLQICETIYSWLKNNGADRNALLINVGGGALCDVGGFCASTYMRGIEFWNIPTTLLAMVDASVGGKNGINLGHHKNYIGTFNAASHVFVSPHWLKTLPREQLLSGWAEVLKHGILIGGKHYQQSIKNVPNTHDHQTWLPILQWNIKVKSSIVERDFTESGERKLLNLGHTIAHALESWSHDTKQAVSHGTAVAWGLVIETKLAIATSEIPAETKALHECIESFVQSLYPRVPFGVNDIPSLINYIKADKKNTNEALLFSVAWAPGNCKYNIKISPDSVVQVLQNHLDDSH